MEGSNGDEIVRCEFGLGEVSSERVGKAVRRIGEFYGCTEDVIRRGMDVGVEVVPKERFVNEVRLYFKRTGVVAEEFKEGSEEEKAVLDAMGVDAEKIKADREKRMRELEESVVKWGGCVIKTEDGKFRVLINESTKIEEEEVLTHELIHVMAGEDDEGGRGVSSRNREGDKFNEAITQLLVLRIKHAGISQTEMLDRIQDGRIETSYADEIHSLLLLLEETKLSGKPVEVTELADAYFSDDPASMKRNLLLMKILGRIPERTRKRFERVYEKYLK